MRGIQVNGQKINCMSILGNYVLCKHQTVAFKCSNLTLSFREKKKDHPTGGLSFLAESVRFELTVGRPITSFQDWLLKPLGQLSVWGNNTISAEKSQGSFLSNGVPPKSIKNDAKSAAKQPQGLDANWKYGHIPHGYGHRHLLHSQHILPEHRWIMEYCSRWIRCGS